MRSVHRLVHGLQALHGTFRYVSAVMVVGIILVLALFLPITELAKATSMIVLIVFAFVNLALLRLKWSGPAPSGDVFCVPVWIPRLGFISSSLLLLAGFLFV